jgi:predicted RNase H-like HicB family nuclease
MPRYPVTLRRDTNDTILVGFPDVPEAHTFGDDEDEALMQAVDALESALSLYVEDRREIPRPSAVERRGKSVIVPARSEAKLGPVHGDARGEDRQGGTGSTAELSFAADRPSAGSVPFVAAGTIGSGIPRDWKAAGGGDRGRGLS